MYNTFCNIISNINNLLWGNFTVLFVLGGAVFLTVRMGFIQVRHPVRLLRSTLFSSKKENPDSGKGISNLQALSTALGASMGTGNIIGVATAISIGGYGAVFWMIVSAFFVMVLAFTENVLGVHYKNIFKKETILSGPLLYIEKGLNCKFITVIYAVACLTASFGIGNFTQANSAINSLDEFGLPLSVGGVILAVMVGLVVFRGGSFVARVSEKIVPVISILYILCSIIIIIISGSNVSEILTDILKSAFGFSQVTGGFTGTIINISLTTGLRRGIFSNEAGMGSSVFAHTSASCNEPCTMGLWAVLEVFIDTVLSCTLTALVILCTGAASTGKEGADIVIEAFRNGLGSWGGYFIAGANFLFAFAAITGWFYYGEKCADYLSKGKRLKLFYRFFYTLAVFFGAVCTSDLLWEISDILNAFMLFPNLAAILILSKKAVPYARDFNA